MKGPGDDFSMSHLLVLNSHFPVGLGGWHDFLECIRLHLTAILISKRNMNICLYILNVRWLILPKRHITSCYTTGGTFIRCGCIIPHNTNCHVNYVVKKVIHVDIDFRNI